ncbi:CdaR family protein [Piscibacillus halophilus]|uniref:CdaR family protein n=1 Tax=Piscibacillus halophilus TaxID=571933 RepID=UPI00158A62D2|nr:CdaR family protein [Piscibacillus halophilus]
MDKWIKSPWFTRIVSLFLALLLYSTVTLDDNTSQTEEPFLFPNGSTETETMENVPLQVDLEEERYVVRGVPETVEVTVEGPVSVVTQAVRQRNFDIFINLNGLEPGTHEVDVQHEGMSSQLSVFIQPQTVEVTIEERSSVTLPVEIEFVGRNGTELSEVFASPPTIGPSEVEITGPKSEIDRIGIVKAIVDFNDITEDGNSRNIPVKVYDPQGNELNVFISPSTVNVEADVSISDKRLPISTETTGELSEDLVLEDINVTPATATMYGPEDTLNGIDQIDPIVIDLSEIRETTTIEHELDVPSGIRKVEPETISVDVEVAEAEERELTDLEIQVDNLMEGKDITFIDPEEREIDVTFIGKEEDLEELSEEDIRVWIDVSETIEGEFYKSIEIDAPDGIRWRTDTEQVRVRIQ